MRRMVYIAWWGVVVSLTVLGIGLQIHAQTLTNKRFTFQDGATVLCLRERCATLDALFAGPADIERHLHACHGELFPAIEFESAIGRPAPRRSERLMMQAQEAARCEATTDVLLHRLEAK